MTSLAAAKLVTKMWVGKMPFLHFPTQVQGFMHGFMVNAITGSRMVLQMCTPTSKRHLPNNILQNDGFAPLPSGSSALPSPYRSQSENPRFWDFPRDRPARRSLTPPGTSHFRSHSALKKLSVFLGAKYREVENFTQAAEVLNELTWDPGAPQLQQFHGSRTDFRSPIPLVARRPNRQPSIQDIQDCAVGRTCDCLAM